MGLSVDTKLLVGWVIPKNLAIKWMSKKIGIHEKEWKDEFGDLGQLLQGEKTPENWEFHVSYSQDSEYSECEQSYYLCMSNKYFYTNTQYDICTFVTAMKNIENCNVSECDAIRLAKEIGITEEMSIIMVVETMW